MLHDYLVAGSPEELVAGRSPGDVILTGEIERVVQGRDVVEMGETSHHVVLQVRVTEVIEEGAAGAVVDGRAYLDFWQGGTVAGLFMVCSLDDWRAALPAGVPVSVVAEPVPGEPKGVEVRDERRGLPPGATLLRPYVQGLHFEGGRGLRGGLVPVPRGSAWAEIGSLAELAGRFRAALASG